MEFKGESPRDEEECSEAHGIRLRRTVRFPCRPRGPLARGVLRGGGLPESFLWADSTRGLDAGEGALDEVLEVGFVKLQEGVEISAGQGAAGMEQAFEVVGGSVCGGADFLDRVLLDGVERGDAQHVLADQFLKALARLVLDDGNFGEQS